MSTDRRTDARADALASSRADARPASRPDRRMAATPLAPSPRQGRRAPLPTRPIGRVARACLVPVTAIAALAVAGCNLDVADPGVVRPDQLADTASLPTLYGGALSDFAVAFAGNSSTGEEGIILAGGLRADEWLNRDTFTTREEIDRGAIQLDNGSLVDVFRNLQRARVSAERAAARFAAAAPDDPQHALASSLAGLTYVLLGESFCSGIPFSSYDEAAGTFTFDAPLTTEQTFQRALARFDAALAVAQRSGDARAINVARIGRARALLDLGRFAEAGQAAAQVPLDFSFDVEFSTNTQRQQNAVYYFNNVDYRWGVADREGGVGAPFVTAEDPRVPVRIGDPDAGEIGLDGEDQTPLVFQGKYGSRSAGIPLATGVEAALIRAEAALQAGNVTAFLAEHNALRARVGLPALTASAATPRRTLEDVHFQERALWLFSTAHRLGDLRRLLRAPYGRAFAEVFPTGEYFKGGVEYGTEANLPIPFDEQNNPRFTACQNRTQ